ncbi:hypothetical protein HZS_2250, partial [Henneguya salminicola]
MNDVESIFKFVNKKEYTEWLNEHSGVVFEENQIEKQIISDETFQDPHIFLKNRYNEPLKKLENRTNFIDESCCIERYNTNQDSTVRIKYDDKLFKNYKKIGGSSKLRTALLKDMSQYRDIVFPCQNVDNRGDTDALIALHSINHILTTNRIIKKNNKLLSKNEFEICRDKGFTRPRILIILPIKSMAFNLVNYMIFIHAGNQIMNKKRFYTEFQPTEEHINLMATRTNFPKDHRLMFEGNTDDYFRLGIGVEKNSLKLYENFYKSDIIIASPLGLRTLIGSPEDPEYDFNFLSSIQIVFLSKSNVCMMQNWEHLINIFSHLNLLPTETTYTDFSRLYEYASNKLYIKSKLYRQTIIFSQFMFPEINALFRLHNKNFSGISIITSIQSPPKLSTQTVLSKFSTDSHHNSHNARFDSFNEILSNIKQQRLAHVLLFVSSYIDYLKLLKNYGNDVFVFICE